MPLKNRLAHLKSRSEFFNCALTERKDSSKLYLKHMKLIKNKTGLSKLMQNRDLRIVSKQVLHSRINQDYDKLYDISPERKKEKLKNARFSKILNAPKVSDHRSHTSLDTYNKFSSKMKENTNKPNSKFLNLNRILPKIKKIRVEIKS